MSVLRSASKAISKELFFFTAEAEFAEMELRNPLIMVGNENKYRELANAFNHALSENLSLTTTNPVLQWTCEQL